MSEWLDLKMPGVPIDGKSVKIIESPAKFYETLLEKSSKAEKRISFSSLYLGDGSLEKELVNTIENRIHEKRKYGLKVKILLDYLRGTRGQGKEKSSTTLLKKIADNADIYLFHTPDLNGIVKHLLSERTNEIIGLQHMKLYIFDDTLIISGANLSDTYFTNRQDRYFVFENCKILADFFDEIIDAVGDCSFVLDNDGNFKLNDRCDVHPFYGKTDEFKNFMNTRVTKVIEDFKEKYRDQPQKISDTLAYPLIQMGTIGIHQEFDFLKNLFSQKREDLKMWLASGYFNTLTDYQELIFDRGEYSLDVLMCSPKTNPFYNSSGFSRFVPALYSDSAIRFMTRRKLSCKENEVKLFEYQREGWSFHAKGLWMQWGNWIATLVGSSNYGYRSVYRDLEAQIMIVTQDEVLKNRLISEKNNIFEYSSIVDASVLRKPEYHVPSLVRFLSRTIMMTPKDSKTKGNPFLKPELIQRLGGKSIRLSHEQIQRERQDFAEALDNEKWIAIYRYPGVRFAVLLARAKLIQTIASVTYLPYSTFQYLNGAIDSTWFYTVSTMAFLAPIMLMIFSRYLNRLIGVIAMNETNEYIRIGYLTFWGSRKNQYLAVDDVVSISETGTGKEDKLVKFMWFSGGAKFFYLPIKHAEILDVERAELLFGDISVFDGLNEKSE
ncbi:unnamed protein product [Caenorhabditis angaria]|uniref:CDP-diacylglycerol--glycerol-3-phosphate 3-phosphatidyltransferase n=1 Tax=Caenorhabditis angaria TaxID=860376 RepID=A0A9P1IV03_9PELO|nr:unnamed protein product [Caenorhabditis angaria]